MTLNAIIPEPWHIPLPRDAVRVRTSAGDDGRLARLAALEAGQMAESLAFLAGYAPGIFDAIFIAAAPCLADEYPAGEDVLEPFCTECGVRAGIFVGRGGDWLHYTGAPEDNDVQPYDADHTPVIGWRPAPGIVVVAR